MKNSILTQDQMKQAANTVNSALDLLRGLHWATTQAANEEDLFELQSLYLGSIPGLFKRLDDVGETLGNGRLGNFD